MFVCYFLPPFLIFALHGTTSFPSPILHGTTSFPSPILHGTTSFPSPILHGTTSFPSPILHGTTSFPSPILHGTTSFPSPILHLIPSASPNILLLGSIHLLPCLCRTFLRTMCPYFWVVFVILLVYCTSRIYCNSSCNSLALFTWYFVLGSM